MKMIWYQCVISMLFLLTVESRTHKNTECNFNVNKDLGNPQPLYLKQGKFWKPHGNTGEFKLKHSEELTMACPGPRRRLVHPNIQGVHHTATIKCEQGIYVTGNLFPENLTNFTEIICSGNAQYTAKVTGNTCYLGHTEIAIGFQVAEKFHTSFRTCFDANSLQVLYAKYELGSGNRLYQKSVPRPPWLSGSFYKDVNPNTKYKKSEQLAHLKELVGEQLAKKYMYQNELTRGHLAAKVDFVLATRQRATFFYINAVPQWSSFNNGNWNTLEENLRRRITSSGGNDVTIWSGSYDVTRLKDTEGNTVEYYLHSDVNGNNQIAVPKYLYKVLYDPVSQHGTAFIGINSVHSTMDEIQEMLFCKDICRNNEQFAWLTWKPDVIMKGYSFCCTIEDFNKTVGHLPHLTVKGVYV